MACQFQFSFFQWLVCVTYLLPNLACGLAMTFSVTGLPHYQSGVAGNGNGDPESTSSAETEMVSTPASGIVLDEDQGSWFGMGFLNSTMLQWYHPKWIWWFHVKSTEKKRLPYSSSYYYYRVYRVDRTEANWAQKIKLARSNEDGQHRGSDLKSTHLFN